MPTGTRFTGKLDQESKHILGLLQDFQARGLGLDDLRDGYEGLAMSELKRRSLDADSTTTAVDFDQVVIERKPHNCERGSAPLEDKHCNYRAIVTPLDPNGEVFTAPGQTPTKVHVGWERVDE